MSEEIIFNYSPFDEDVVIVGGKGRGKSERAKWLKATQIPNIPSIMYDYNNIFSNFGTIARRPSEIFRGDVIYQGLDRTMKGFVEFCNRVFYGSQSGELANMVLFVDELHQYYKNKQTVVPEFENIVATARNYGISGVYLSTRPAAIPNTVLSNAQHCFAYGLANEGDISWLHGYIGEKAWLLVPPDKRKKLTDEKMLTKHSCIYRNQMHPYSQMIICNCNLCNQERQQFPEAFF